MAASEKLTCLTISDLSYSYRNNPFVARSKRVLQNINLTLPPGEITYILGPNGAGKSTLINCITGIRSGYTGEIKFPPGSRMAALLDDPFVYTSLTVQENIRIFLRYHQMEYSDYHESLNQHLEVDELLDQRYKKLSLGQRQRLLLFLSMINDPDIVLLDEPFNGLDPFYAEKLIALLLRLKKDGRMILVNDHIIAHTMRLADQIAFLIQHELVYVVTPDLLEQGLYYTSNDVTGSVVHAPIPFCDCIQKRPPSGQEGALPISSLTELYTLAVNYGRTNAV